MKINKKAPVRLMTLALALVLGFSLTACVDLGVFNADDEYQSYYDAFGAIEGIYDGGEHNYDVERSLFNGYTVEHLDWENDDDKVAYEEYVYIVIPFNTDLKIESLALYVNGSVAVDVEISAFYFENASAAPSNIKYRSSPETEIVKVTEDGKEVEKEVEIEYDDPPKDVRIATAVCYVSSKWNSFMLEKFSQSGFNDGYLHTSDDGLLYLRIENNSGFNKDMLSCSFRFIDLLIRAV